MINLKTSIINFMLLALLLSILVFISGCITPAQGQTAIEEFNNQSFNPIDPMTLYGFKEVDDWSGWNKFWLGSAIATYGVGDTVSTINALDRGCVEANPILGKDPDTGIIIVGKLLFFGATWYVIENWIEPEQRQNTRNWMYGLTSVLGGAVTVHNSTINCN